MLENPPEAGALFDLAFSESRGIAAGVIAGGEPVAGSNPLLLTGGTSEPWHALITATLPATGIASAAGFTSDGDALAGGVDTQNGSAFLLDERGGWSRIAVSIGPLAFAVSGDTARMAGSGTGSGLVYVSTTADAWTPETLPFPGDGGERGLEDLAARDGVFYACGFDDGADGTPESPTHVLFRNAGTGWERLDAPCGGCTNREFRAVAITPSGALLLAGAITDFSAGAPDAYVAFLLSRSVGDEWTEVVLPQAGELDRVNDILVAEDGSIYLACGLGQFHSVRLATGEPARLDNTVDSARVRRLAQAPDGTVWAAGEIITDLETGAARPALWKRTG